MLRAILGQVWTTLKANKLRAFLTMFGIAWGVLSIILMTAMGEGFRVSQRNSTRNLGKNILIIWGGRTSIQSEGSQAGRDIRLHFSDAEALRQKADLLAMVSPELSRWDLTTRTPLNYGAFNINGVYPEYQYMRTIDIGWGRPLNVADNQEARRVCILGPDTNDQLFGDQHYSVGETVKINGHPFTVVGVMAYKFQNSNYSGPDRNKIWMPYHTMRRLFPHPARDRNPNFINNIIAMPVSGEINEDAERQVRQILGEKKGFDPTDDDAIWIWNTAKMAAMIDTIIRSMQWFLGSVGAVTLILGAVGVINIMLVSVRERTVEIGLRKSVGARRRDIIFQFFAESSALCLISGGIGLLGGLGFCRLVNQLPMPEEVFAGMIVSPQVGVAAFSILAVVGLVSGIYPAYVAADMDPIEALRYEAN